MAFRYEEAVEAGNEQAKSDLLPKGLAGGELERSRRRLKEIISEYGPAVGTYPTWHPLVSNHKPRATITSPRIECGYQGLDHTKYFVNAFITCPYGDGQNVIDSVDALQQNGGYAWISAERLDVTFYSESTIPILVFASYPDPLGAGQTIPKNIAVPLMMHRELLDWPGSTVAESWETMRYYLLGSPHGMRSSLFVDQDTALAIKKMHTAMNETGMFGPVAGR